METSTFTGFGLKRLIEPEPITYENLTALDSSGFAAIERYVASESGLQLLNHIGATIVSKGAVVMSIRQGILRSPTEVKEKLLTIKESFGDDPMDVNFTATRPIFKAGRAVIACLDLDSESMSTIRNEQKKANSLLGVSYRYPHSPHVSVVMGKKGKYVKRFAETVKAGVIPCQERLLAPSLAPTKVYLLGRNEHERRFIKNIE